MKNNETPSWLAIFASVIGLIALLWSSVNEKFPAGMGAAMAAMREPGAVLDTEKTVSVAEPAGNYDSTTTVEVAEETDQQTGFSLQVQGDEARVQAVLPKGARDKALWNTLREFYKEPFLAYELEFAETTKEEDWVAALPAALVDLLSSGSVRNLGLVVSPDQLQISGEVSNIEDRRSALSAVRSLLSGDVVLEDKLQMAAASLQAPILKAVATGNLLELTGRLPSYYEQSPLAENLKVAMGAGFVDNAIEYTDRVEDADILLDLGEKLVDLPKYGDNPSVFLQNGELSIALENSPPEKLEAFSGLLEQVFAGTSVKVSASETETAMATETVEPVIVTNSDPMPAVEPMAEISQTPRLLEVTFGYNSFELLAGSLDVLDRLVVRLDSEPGLDLIIEGHTDSTGNAQANQYLSQMRADTVKNYLIDSGIAANRLQAVGMGDARPIANNGTRSGRSKNRRIEIRKGKS